MKSADLREKFSKFFVKYKHETVKSSSLIPFNDPTLLFTNAGMVQFKDVFLGSEKKNFIRASSCQKCLRAGGKHNDLENVGRTRRHHTFFEMLGNFSFGDYFKTEAIEFAWEFLTKELKIPTEKLYITVHKDDQEAEEIWKNKLNVKASRIYKLGDKDNFWSMGDTGPCGPCSEILYDLGKKSLNCPNPKKCNVECDCGRYLEIWNLVFMQFDKSENGELTELPSPSIDTGMGLERLASVLQNVESNYDTDSFTYLIDSVSKTLSIQYGKDESKDISIRVLADHSRAVTFLIADGVTPSSEGRGYVLRRILRRAVRHYKMLGINEPYLFNLCSLVIDEMKNTYPELKNEEDNIVSIVKNEEEKFLITIDKGLEQLQEAMNESEETKILSGKHVFKLYDTFGFPVDLIEDILRDSDYSLDLKGYEEEMIKQKKSSKKASKFKSSNLNNINFQDIVKSDSGTTFQGYKNLSIETTLLAILQDNEVVSSSKKGQKVDLIFEETPFYAESGGQVGDIGAASNKSCLIDILDTQKSKEGFYIHSGIIKDGEIKTGERVSLSVDKNKRYATSAHHTATHILNSCLRDILGSHVRQAGSLVESNRLRFDFSHFSNIDQGTLSQIERLCNDRIRLNFPIEIRENVEYKRAIKEGATAFFEEKYGDVVRVVKIGDFSMELCGGIHVNNTGELGFLHISSEGAVSSGIRRIEAHTGDSAYHHIENLKKNLVDSSALLNSSIENIPTSIARIQKENNELKQNLNKIDKKNLNQLAEDIYRNSEIFNDSRIIYFLGENMTANQIKLLWDNVKTNQEEIIGLFISNNENKSIIICASNSKTKSFDCKEAINKISAQFNGKGGGNKNLAQAGCDRVENIDSSVEIIKSLL
ncbi:MAG: alanine--tRNA ligase [Thermodesulfobacteriota bacterium]|nr:alanine--tRNA ligase [Thermodesulfobacteriota bacterium]